MDVSQHQVSEENAVPFGTDNQTSGKDELRGREIERLTSSVARLTGTSVEGLEGLTAELQELQKFLKTEVERVQAEIDSALAGIKIIVDTITPWKTSGRSLSPQTTARGVRSNGISRA